MSPVPSAQNHCGGRRMAATTGFKVQCPSCEAMVTIKNASLIGKKIDCPKCKYRFVVEAPGDEEEGAAGGALRKGAAGGNTAVANKKSAGKARAKSEDGDESRPKKKSNMVLFVGVGIALLAVGILVAAYFGGLFGDDEPSKPSTTPVATSKPGNTGNAPAPPGVNESGEGGTPVAHVGGAEPSGPGSPRDATNL